MKSTIMAILVILLVGGLVAPAAAGPLIADVLLDTTGARCGTVSQSGNVVQIRFTYTGTSCAATPVTPFTFALCRVDVSGTLFFETDLVDLNQNGKIDVNEGLKFNLLAAGENVTHWVVEDTSGACGNTALFSTGFRK